jgi:preprotein translocase subunit SecY
VTSLLGHGKPLFLALYVMLIVFFAFFYTSIHVQSERDRRRT